MITRDGYFYPNLTRIMGSFCCSQLTTKLNKKKKNPEVPGYVVMRHGIMASPVSLVIHFLPTCCCLIFIFLMGWYVLVCEIDFFSNE